jgi:ketosteroid isomerase-like protein
MSRENVEIVRRAYEAFGRGRAYAIGELIASEFELALFPPYPSGPFRGPEGLADFSKEFDETFEEWWLEPEEFLDAGDRVAALVRFRARSKGADVPVEAPLPMSGRSATERRCGRTFTPIGRRP